MGVTLKRPRTHNTTTTTGFAAMMATAFLLWSTCRAVRAWQPSTVSSTRRRSPPAASFTTSTTTARQYAVDTEIVAAAATLTRPQRGRRTMLTRRRSDAQRQRPRPRLKSVTQAQSSATTKTTTSKKDAGLLTRDEEVMYSYRLRTLRAAIRIRDELVNERKQKVVTTTAAAVGTPGPVASEDQQPQHPPVTPTISDAEWAAACGTTPRELRRWLDQGREAREVLVSANVGLVTSIARKHYRKLRATSGGATILTLQDMMQEGNLGLLKAAERFEPERGFRFSTYATYWIRQRIGRSIDDHSRPIRLPAHVHGTLSRVHRTRAEFQASEGRNPSSEELAAALEMSTRKLQKLTDAAQSVLSLQTPLRASSSTTDNDTRTLADGLASAAPSPEEECATAALRADVHDALRTCLTDAERAVVTHRFGLHGDGRPPCSIAATGRALRIAPESVRHVEARALNKLRRNLGVAALQDYVVGGGGDGTAAAKTAPSPSPSARVTKKKIWESAAWDPVGHARAPPSFASPKTAAAPTTTRRQSTRTGTASQQQNEPIEDDARSDRLWFF